MAKGILRPLDYGGIFDEMFDLYKKRFVLLVGIGAVVYIPVYAFTYAFGPISTIIGSCLIWLSAPLVLAATTYAVSRCYLNEDVSILASYGAVARRMFWFILTWLVAVFFALLGFVPMIPFGLLAAPHTPLWISVVGWIFLSICGAVPCVILMFRYTFISSVFVLEGKACKDARVRSAFLARGNVGRIFVLALLTALLVYAISLVIMAPLQIAMIAMMSARGPANMAGPIGVAFGIVAGIATALTNPLQIIAFILLYYDIRIRKEGFDIEMLANNMGASAPVAVETPVPAAVAVGSEVEERPAMLEPEVEAGSATPEPEAQTEHESHQP